MPYKMNWYIPNRVIYIHASGDVPLDEYKALVDESNEMISQGTAPVHAITNMLEVTSLPNNIATLRASSERPDNAGWSIIINNKIIFNFLIGIVGQVLRAEVKMVRSTQEAIETLRRVDSLLERYINPADPLDQTKNLPGSEPTVDM